MRLKNEKTKQKTSAHDGLAQMQKQPVRFLNNASFPIFLIHLHIVDDEYREIRAYDLNHLVYAGIYSNYVYRDVIKTSSPDYRDYNSL